MTHQELREKYLSFFEIKGHKRIPSASLLPENDATVLFTTAGMHPLVPFLLGEKHPAGNRLTSCQKCVRTGDIEEVGDAIHLTFFEMLGNWSLGDYFKEDAIKWSWEFLTDKQWLGLDKNRLAVSVFAPTSVEGAVGVPIPAGVGKGHDLNASFDEESYNLWKNFVVSEKRIAKLPKKNNWWGPAGTTGPCGPDTEMFYWTGDEKTPEVFDTNDVRWVEIWNDVFMQYNKTIDGSFEPLKQKNVDTGMGLERVLAILNNKADVYETELFLPIIEKIEMLSGKKYQDYQKEFRIIADHIKAAVFMLAEGLEPSNVERGYVLRRLIRRAVSYEKLLGIINVSTFEIGKVVSSIYKDVYFEVKQNLDFIERRLTEEEEKFQKILGSMEKDFEKIESILITQLDKILSLRVFSGASMPNSSAININTIDASDLTGDMLFPIVTSRGIPLELCLEHISRFMYDFIRKYNKDIISFDVRTTPFGKRLIKEFNEKMRKHQELSHTASAGMFKGGLADNSEQVVKYHTTTHLLHAALRQILGQEVGQKGSNLNVERLRFDFSYGQKMTPEQIKQVEDIVNEKIQEKLSVKMEEMNLDEAKKSGAIGLFAEKYGDKVKVYSIGNFSKEICGGPHVENIGMLGHFKIIKEEAVSAGVRRIKAILE
ncbi:MAG TPA: alanine--tRNA ligase-related protein [Candidatus Paceibacterota bacterium]|nr:alanine--tRNA ligase-related protein [Candidatus Paceibacterota bacterium]HPT40379.1 alanine--tRNA ligase-related protein [Candidatus Paceibacterota bacterium]